MSISKEEVQHVAKLARLTLTPEETTSFTQQLNQILDYAEALKELDTDGVKPMSHPMPEHNRMREDQVIPSIERELALANAPEQEEGMFKVPPVFKG
ncbi:aspartyl/glutamyl-tRNA(Asn/Gln) amidotransferase subunit C [Seinonella peptonophila]|uniref:Aspartyl/glutamyl-tRNA(Asn/Gln) amidotransferase subunit C n=1 Tax=Seinonella peptonophila TaxID=112248 RepID=A0A1M4Z2Q1_9BACL|nr:Asp-tRNA(Asn)/Glu-tRNA(Gln) amidotransferase subunit GatC [Seinonella peptonophila]SHF12321.1 aspartyl/glutamyl-tRNA(Asn/Gln) amidotransferase subunit C [Seinonella peptonophila]